MRSNKSISIAFSILVVTFPLIIHPKRLFSPDDQQQTRIRSQELNATQVIPRQLIVKLKSGYGYNFTSTRVNIASIDAILDCIGVYRITPLLTPKNLLKGRLTREEDEIARIIKVYYSAEIKPREAVRLFESTPAVEYAEPLFMFPAHHTPNDPRLAQQYAIALHKLEQAWDLTTGDSTIVIGILDTGIDFAHEDLQGAIWINPGEWGNNGELKNNGRDDDGNGKVDDYRGWDFVGAGSIQFPFPDNNPTDYAGHGTMVSGCVAAQANNGIGIAGTSYRSKILPIKLSSDNGGLMAYDIEAITYAVQMKCKVINCSFGGAGGSADYMRTYRDVINYANSQGTLIVSSAGNLGLNLDLIPQYPASFDHVLGVGAVETNGTASDWGNYGTSVHVYGLGNTVLSTTLGGGYGNDLGTSLASPLTAGIAALVFSIHPNWSPDQVAKQIRVTCDQFGVQPDSKHYGRVNAHRAVTVNNTLSDIPGFILSDFTVTGLNGGMLTEPGQQAHVRITLQNILAPSSPSTSAQVEFDGSNLTASQSVFPLGVVVTNGTFSFEFDVTFSQTPSISEGLLLVRIRITDGAYNDYILGRIRAKLKDGWHSTIDLTTGGQFVWSLDVVSDVDVWALGFEWDITTRTYYPFGLKTGNAGTTWSAIMGSGYPPANDGRCITGVNSQTAFIGAGFISGNGAVYRTTNSGASWQKTDIGNVTKSVNWICMWDANNGVLGGNPVNNVWGIATTSNGGVSWQPLSTPIPADSGALCVANAYSQIGDIVWFATTSNKIFKSTDRGRSWRSIVVPGTWVSDISFRDSQTGVLRFEYQPSKSESGQLAVTTDGGETWERNTSFVAPLAPRVLMEKGGVRLWVLTMDTAYVSTDLGTSWSMEPTLPTFNPRIAADHFVGSQNTTIFASYSSIYKFISPVRRPVFVDEQLLPHSGLSLSISPNPTQDKIIINISTLKRIHIRIEILDPLGRMLTRIYEGEIPERGYSTGYSFNNTFPHCGVFFIRVSTGQEMKMSKFMVIR